MLRTYVVYNTVVRWCQFLVVAGNSSQNENTFQQKNLIGWVTLLWSASRCVYFIRPNTHLLCIFLFWIFLLYRADPQVEVQIKIRAPLGARAYPWILSKYFLCVRACVRPCVCPPRDKRRVCIFCVKTLNLCCILVVFCSYLEYNSITPFSFHVLYQLLHTYFFLVQRS